MTNFKDALSYARQFPFSERKERIAEFYRKKRIEEKSKRRIASNRRKRVRDVHTPNPPISVNGYYPLYESYADVKPAIVSKSKGFEKILLNGVWYYRPRGIKVYNGDYKEPNEEQKETTTQLEPFRFQIINIEQDSKKKVVSYEDAFSQKDRQTSLNLSKQVLQILPETKVSESDTYTTKVLFGDTNDVSERSVIGRNKYTNKHLAQKTVIPGKKIELVNPSGITQEFTNISFVSGSNIRLDTDPLRPEFIRISLDALTVGELEDVSISGITQGSILSYDTSNEIWKIPTDIRIEDERISLMGTADIMFSDGSVLSSANIIGDAPFFVSFDAPEDPTNGTRWYDIKSGNLFTYIIGDDFAYWIQA